MDEKDRKIINILRRNPRTSYVKIANEIGLSEPAARRRVNNLTNSGVIRFTIEISKECVRGIVHVSVTDTAMTKAVSRDIADLEGTEHVFEVTGIHDIVAIVQAGDISRLNRLCIDRIRAMPNIRITDTVIVLKKVKTST